MTINQTPAGQLAAFFNKYIPLNRKEGLLSRVTELSVKRRQFILQPTDASNTTLSFCRAVLKCMQPIITERSTTFNLRLKTNG